MGFFKKKDSATSYGFRSLLELNKSMNMIFTSFKVKKYKKTSRATSALDTSVVLGSVLI